MRMASVGTRGATWQRAQPASDAIYDVLDLGRELLLQMRRAHALEVLGGGGLVLALPDRLGVVDRHVGCRHTWQSHM